MSSDKNIRRFQLRVPENWPIGAYEDNVLYIGFIKKEEGARNKNLIERNLMESLLSAYGEIEQLVFNQRYAVVSFKYKSTCDQVYKGLKNKAMGNVTFIVGRTWNHLGNGRLQLINDLDLTTVVVKCQSIKPGQGGFLRNLFGRHGSILEVDAMVGKATITFNERKSVISCIAVENDLPLNGMKKSVELDTENLDKSVVKVSTLALIHNITDVCLQSRGQLEEERIRLVFQKYGDIAHIDTLSENIKVSFFSASAVTKALDDADLANTPFEPIILAERLQQTLSVIQPEVSVTGGHMISQSLTRPGGLTRISNAPPSPCTYPVPPMQTRPPPSVFSIPTPTVLPITRPALPLSRPISAPVLPTLSTTPMIAPAMTVPPPSPQVVKVGGVNDIEVICTMPECMEYSKHVCTQIRSLRLKVGVLCPPPGVNIDEIVESMIASGVAAAAFIDKCNQNQTTLSIKFFDHREIKLKDVPLHLALGEISKAFFGNTNIDRAQVQVVNHPIPPLNVPPPMITQPPPSIQQHPSAFPSTSKQSSVLSKKIAMKTLIEELLDNKSILMKDINDLMKYFLDMRERQLTLEYDDYIPQRVKQPPIGPFADMEKKIVRGNIEDLIDEVMKRNLDEDLEHHEAIQAEAAEKEKLASVLTSLLSLESVGLKNGPVMESLQSLRKKPTTEKINTNNGGDFWN